MSDATDGTTGSSHATGASADPGSEVELAVIGGGNMGAALLGGLVASGRFGPGHLAVVEPVAARRTDLAAQFPDVQVLASIAACRGAVLAVKPYDLTTVAAAAAASGAERLLSIAAGISTAAIEAAVPAGVRVVRSMPNTPALVGAGMSAVCGGAGAEEADLVWAESILGAVGTCVRVPESLFDAVTGVTGSGPAYLFLVAEAMIDAAVLTGLARPTAESMVAQLFVGSAALLADRGDPAALRAMVTSPGGTTAAALHVLESRAVRAAFIDAVRASAERSRQLG
jgi:pyrroline-5-carboxylate reductase